MMCRVGVLWVCVVCVLCVWCASGVCMLCTCVVGI